MVSKQHRERKQLHKENSCTEKLIHRVTWMQLHKDCIHHRMDRMTE